MKSFLFHAAVVVAIGFLAAFLAALLASVMAEQGMLGSCFEGGCAYAAAFVAFPLLWSGMVLAGIALWVFVWRRVR